MKVLGIDPGTKHVGIVVFNMENLRVERAENTDVYGAFDFIRRRDIDACVIERVTSRSGKAGGGQIAGNTTIDTAMLVGRYHQAWLDRAWYGHVTLLPRYKVKSMLGLLQSANDKTIRDLLIDVFGPTRSAAVGKKADQGPLYGVSGHAWQALALIVAEYNLIDKIVRKETERQ